MTYILASSTYIPCSDTLCPSTIPSRTMKWHFSQFWTKCFSLHRYSIQVLKTIIESLTIDEKIIHENFHDFFDHIREDGHHAPLKINRGIAQTKKHSSICICPIGACESGLTLVIGMDRNLMISPITIKETKERVLCKPFQHLIDER